MWKSDFKEYISRSKHKKGKLVMRVYYLFWNGRQSQARGSLAL